MSSPFQAAWMLLKNVRGGPTGRRMPMTEEESYGDVSFREHPLHGLEDDDESIDDSGSMPPMSRTLGGTPPANIGRAGSTGAIPTGRQRNAEQTEMFGIDDIDDAGIELEFNDDASPVQQQQLIDRINQNIEPFNPFPKPLAGRVQDQLAEFADTAGRRAAMKPQPDYSKHENSTDLFFDSFDENFDPINSVPTDAHPEAHNIASTNLRQTPRKQKRGKMDSGQAFKRPGFRGPAMPLPGGKGD